MSKYSKKFKKKIAKEYLNGSAITQLKRKYGIGGDHTIQNWATQYQSGVLDTGDEMSFRVKYSSEFKDKVLSDIRDKSDIYTISKRYGIEHGVIKNWYDTHIINKIPTKKKSEREVYKIDPDVDIETPKTKEYRVDDELKVKKQEQEINFLKNKNKTLLNEIDAYKTESKLFRTLDDSFIPKVIKTTPNVIKGRESAVILQWSDWHIEETVKLQAVNGLNEFNLDVANRRIDQLVNDSCRIIDTIKSPYKVKKIVIHLGGDFISGNIHDELMETNSLLPTDAIILAQNKIAGSIDYLLNTTDLPIEIVASTGNHGRMTNKQRISSELGNSLEHYMYFVLESRYASNKRIKFHQQQAYHTILDIYGTIVRFHHGHFMRFGGGVGGPTIPINKAISNWNKSIRNVSLDVFGHFHQSLLGKSFIMNGSLIGWNPYAINIKAEYEPPSQNLFVIDSLRGRTMYNPIILE